MNSGDGCTTLQMYSTPLNCTLKMVKMVNLRLQEGKRIKVYDLLSSLFPKRLFTFLSRTRDVNRFPSVNIPFIKSIFHPNSKIPPEVPLSVLGVSSHLFLRALEVAPPWPGVAWPGVSPRPGVAAPAGV